jgi:hypothetical protein
MANGTEGVEKPLDKVTIEAFREIALTMSGLAFANFTCSTMKTGVYND